MNAVLPLAGRGRRFVATLIDMVLVPALAILLMLVTGVLEHAEDWSKAGCRFCACSCSGWRAMCC